MIVEPDFLDHWKTRLLTRLLGTESAPLYVLRLWSHCQTRKSWRFEGWTPDVLASVCRWEGDAVLFWNSMLATYCNQDGSTLVAHDWDESNSSLIANWNNGQKGGRPKNNPPETHGLTQQKPMGYALVNPPETHQEPTANPPETRGVTDRLDREDKIEKTDGTEKTDAPSSRRRFTPPTREELDLEAGKLGLPQQQVDLFVNYYASKGWKVGKSPMVSWKHSLAGWKTRWQTDHQIRGQRLIGTNTPDDAGF